MGSGVGVGMVVLGFRGVVQVVLLFPAVLQVVLRGGLQVVLRGVLRVVLPLPAVVQAGAARFGSGTRSRSRATVSSPSNPAARACCSKTAGSG
ncbi:hypothetical protein GCM10010252_12770 [Streptomyces aureoverticillatus]|nr:hypothetical protein GCM10010252_12770 [Streptomyces aureoverticillatus]